MNKAIIFKTAGLIIIFAAALIIRIYPVLKSPEKMHKGYGPFGDTNLYHCIAYNLYHGHGFSGTDDGTAYGINSERITTSYEPAVSRGPAYPLFILFIYKFFGNPQDMKSWDTWHSNWDKIRVAQCMLDALVCLLVFFIVRLIYPASLWPAFISAILYVFSYYNIFYTRALLSESITTFLLALAILFGVLGLKSGKKGWLFLTGAGFGLVVLSRTEYVLFFLFLAALIFFVNRKSLHEAFKKILIFLIGLTVVIGPWMLRNYIVFKKPGLITVGALGTNMYLGTFVTKDNWTDWGEFPEEVFSNEQEKQEVYSLFKSFHEVYTIGSIRIKQFDGAFMKLALKRIKNGPLGIMGLWIKKIPRLWYQDYIKMYAYVEASGWFFVFYFIFALLAFFLGSAEEKVLMAPIGLLFIYLTLVFLPQNVEPRYGVALMPGIISLTGLGIWKLFLWIKNFLVKHSLIDFVSDAGIPSPKVSSHE